MDDRKCRGPVRKTPLLSVVLLISVAMATGMILPNDPNCMATGGLCATKESCPEESVVVSKSENKWCTSPDRNGVCCSTLPDDLYHCRDRGGRCGDEKACQKVENFGKMDCKRGTQCCLLIY